VSKYRDLDTGRTVVVREVHVYRKDLRTAYSHRIKIIRGSIRCHNIVRITQGSIKDSVASVITKFYKFGSFEDIMKRNCSPLSESQIARVLYSTLFALKILHKNGLSHNTIGARKIFLSCSYHVKLGGLFNSYDGDRTIVPSPLWMAPEALRIGASGGVHILLF